MSSKCTAARKTKKNIDIGTIQTEITQAKFRLFESILCLNDVAMRIENQDHWTLKKEALSGVIITIAFLSFLWTTTNINTTPLETVVTMV